MRAMLTARQWRQVWYLPILAIAMALMMLRIMLVARMFDLQGFAHYSAALLLSTTFCMLGCLGLQSLLQRDMPVFFARRRVRAALVLMVQSMLVACICAAVLVLPAALGAGHVQLPPGLAALAVVHGLSQQLFLVVTVESRSEGDPLRYARQNLVRALAVVGAGGFAAWTTRSAAWVLGTEATFSLLIVAGILRTIEGRSGWSLAQLVQMANRSWRRIAWTSAVVMLGVTVVNFVLLNIDRWAGAAWLRPVDFAQFAFAGVLLLVAQSAQGMVNAAAYPMIARRYALHGPGAAFRLCSRTSLAALTTAVVLAWPGYHAGVWAIARWYPAYVPAVPLLNLLLAAAMLRVSDFWSSFLMICGHERVLLGTNVAVCALGFAVWFALESAGGGFAATPAAICRLTLLLAVASYTVTAFAAFWLRARARSHPLQGRFPDAQPQ
jgi:O-antigen/teichoic acid export membrane protein